MHEKRDRPDPTPRSAGFEDTGPTRTVASDDSQGAPGPYKEWDHDSVEPTTSDPFFLDHLSRYYQALRYIDGECRVLDVACGKGYGSALLATRAKHVTGIDLNNPSLEFARANFARENIEYRQLDVLE